MAKLNEEQMNQSIKSIDSEFEIPVWIDHDMTFYTLKAILHGGCNSGAYMPSSIEFEANQTMLEHGTEVFDFLEKIYGEIPNPAKITGWGELASFYLSTAVETWANYAYSVLEEKGFIS